MSSDRKTYWIDINRFDKKPNKSVLLEMVSALNDLGRHTEILTGYGDEKYQPQNNVKLNYFDAINAGGLFRISLQLKILLWIITQGRKQDVYILPPSILYLSPMMWLFGRRNIHLDIRSFHVDIHSLKDRLGNLLFWTIPLRLFGKMPKGYSFITERLRLAVESDVSLGSTDYAIWQSGANVEHFKVKNIQNKNSQEKFILFYHGTVSDNRGVYRVIQALAKVEASKRQNIQYVIVGSGPGYARLSTVVEEEGLEDNVLLKGRIPYEDIPLAIAEADCCICPLPALPEWDMSSPLKLMEYMASAKPMILTPIPAHKDVLDDQSFVVWSDGDSLDDLAKAITQAYDHRAEISVAAMGAPEIVSLNYEWRAQGKKLASYLGKTFD